MAARVGRELLGVGMEVLGVGRKFLPEVPLLLRPEVVA
jgi:hypothetical protein